MDVQRVVRELDWKEIGKTTTCDGYSSAKMIATQDAPSPSPVDSSSFSSWLRIPANGKQRQLLKGDELERAFGEHAQKWCSDLRLPRLGCFRKLPLEVALPASVVEAHTLDFQHLAEHSPTVASVVGSAEGAITTCEDKDPSVLWRCPKQVLLSSWRIQFDQAHARWEWLDISAEEVTAYYKEVLADMFPSSFRFASFVSSMIPYAYPTIKKKCMGSAWELITGILVSFSSNGVFKTCKKAGHSCLRTIVSFIRLPQRKALRKISRCIDFLVTQLCPGYDLSNLSQASNDITNRFAQVCPRQSQGCPFHCVDCGCLMVVPGVRVSDAAQAFEMIPSQVINASLKSLFSRARKSTRCMDPTIQVYAGKKPRVAWGGLARDRLSDRSVFFLSVIEKCVFAVLRLRIFMIGNLSVKQKSGVPIGGASESCYS